MILDKTHKRWCIGTLSSLAVLTLGYVAYVTLSRNEPSGGSIPGLAFGILAFLLMAFAFLLGLRRRFPAARLGSGQWWLRGHLWLGGLTVPVVLFHSGFRFGGPLEQALMWSFVIVVATGVYGLLIQQFLPRLIRHAVPDETFVDQIPYVCQRNLILCDYEVSRNTSPLAVIDDVMIDQFGPIVISTKKMLQVKEERKKNKAKGEGDEKGAISENWMDNVPSGLRELFRSLAQYAKDHNWPITKDGGTGNMRLLEEFPMSLPLIYKLKSVVDSAPREPTPGGDSPDGGNRPNAGPGPRPVTKAAAPQSGEKTPVMASVAQRTPAGPPAEAAVEGGKRVEGSDAPVAPPRVQPAAPAVGAGSDGPAKPQLSAGAAVPATAEPAAPAADAESGAPAKPTLSPAAAALQAKLAAKKAGGAAPVPVSAEPAAAAVAPAPAEPAALAADEGSEAPAKPALSPAAAALQAKLAAKKAGGAAPASAAAEPVAAVTAAAAAEPGAPAADAGSEATAKPALSPAAAALQAKLAAKKAGAAAPAPAEPAAATVATAPAASSGSDAPAKPALSSGAAALQAKLAAKKAGATNPAPTAAPAEPPQTSPEAGVKTPLEAKPATVKSAELPTGGEKPARPLPKALPGKSGAAAPGGGPSAAAKPAADEIPSHSRQRLLDFYLGQVRSFLIPDRKPSLSALANEDTGRSLFFQLRGELPAALHGTLNLMEHYCTERRQLRQLQRLHWQLHWWLGLHIPASAAVIVLMVIHAIVAARVIPFFN